MKNYAIILDEENAIRVVPSKWLTDGRDAMLWPPFTKKSEITDAVIKLKDVSSDWKKYWITKFIKSNDNYIDAINDSKMNLEALTDASDDDKVKKSRSLRHKKKIDNSNTVDGPSAKKNKKDDNLNIEGDAFNNSKEDDIFNNSKDDDENDKCNDDDLSESSIDMYVNADEDILAPANLNVTKSKSSPAKPKVTQPNIEERKSSKKVESSARNVNDVASTSESIQPAVQTLTNRQLLLATYGLMTKLLEKTNRNGIRIEKLESKIDRVRQKNTPDNVVLSMDDIATINTYFPVDTNEANKNKKILVEEKKFAEKDKVFLKNVHMHKLIYMYHTTMNLGVKFGIITTAEQHTSEII